jgi:hypothetical protein
MAKVWVALPAVAVNVTVCAVLNVFTVAEKFALLDPAATVTDAGTVTAALLLDRFTVNPPVAAAAFRVTVQLSLPKLFIDPPAQLNPVRTGTPVPLRLTVVELPVDELLVSVRVPDIAPAVVGSNCTVSVAVWLGVKVRGKVVPEMEKPVPVTAAALTVTDAVPVDDNVTDFVVVEFTAKLPNGRLVALTPRIGVDPPS